MPNLRSVTQKEKGGTHHVIFGRIIRHYTRLRLTHRASPIAIVTREQRRLAIEDALPRRLCGDFYMLSLLTAR